MNNTNEQNYCAARPVDKGMAQQGVMGTPPKNAFGRKDVRSRARRAPPMILFSFGFCLAFVLGQLSASSKNSLLSATTTATFSLSSSREPIATLPTLKHNKPVDTQHRSQQTVTRTDVVRNDDNDDKELTFQSALNTLSCFMSPGCFPSYPCHTGKPKKLRRGKSWEELPFCVEDLTNVTTRKQRKS
jgi:hypothetical protein